MAAGSLVDAATALEARMATEGGLQEQLARPSGVPSDVGGTALGFVCSRDVQSGEVLHRTMLLLLCSHKHPSAQLSCNDLQSSCQSDRRCICCCPCALLPSKK